MTSDLYATPRDVSDPASCTFYQIMDLPGYGVVDGHWDLLAMLGFDILTFTRNHYLCHGKRARIFTIVAQRR